MTYETAILKLREFVNERDWGRFHTEENLAKSVVIEGSELLECFQWGTESSHDRIREELADVLTYCYLLADKLAVNPNDLVLEKLAVTAQKYPVSLSRGRSVKYTEL